MARPPDLVGLFIRPLEEIHASYMITGGVAAVIYGDPRFTRDIDIVLALRREDVPRLLSAFDDADFYVPPREAVEAEVDRQAGGHFNVIHHETALRADVYLAGDDPFHAWAFARCLRLEVGTTTISVAPIEYVIIRKLEYFRHSGSDRHLRDIAMMFRLSGETIASDALDEWCGRKGLAAALEQARSFRAE